MSDAALIKEEVSAPQGARRRATARRRGEDHEARPAGVLPKRGRGAQSNESGRFEPHVRITEDDGWGSAEEDAPRLLTTVTIERPKTIITRNDSPDISFDRSINPYRGCEHGCIYCFARPTHAYMGLSPGLDFE